TRALASKGEGLAEAGFGLSQVTLVEQKITATIKRVARGRITRSVPAIDLHGLAAGFLRLRRLAFEGQDPGKRVESLGHGGMLVAHELFSNRQRLTKETFSLGQFALVLNDDSELGQRFGDQSVFFARDICHKIR